MYARKYYLLYIEEICYLYMLPEYSRTSQQQYSRTSQQPIVFLCKVTFDLFAIRCIHHIHQIHLVHHSLFHFHFFTFFSPFSLLFLSLSPPISLTIHSSLPHNIRDKD